MSALTKRARALLVAASPAPWKAAARGKGAFYVHAVTHVVVPTWVPGASERPMVAKDHKRQIGKFYDHWEGRIPVRPANGQANAELAAAAPELIDELCKEVERLEVELEKRAKP